MKKILSALYIATIVCLAAATIIERRHGSAFTAANIYGAWWFSCLWAALAAVSVAYIIKVRARRLPVIALHASLAVILAGALATHISARQGMLHLRKGEGTSIFLANDMHAERLPFTITLDSFETVLHDDGRAVADYRSHITMTAAAGDARQKTRKATVSMNNICSYKGARLYQSDYDYDGEGSYLAVNIDPWGIPVTYAGYALLFISFALLLAHPEGSFRRLLRRQQGGSAWSRKARTTLLATLATMFLAQTFRIALRWNASGTIPMSNAYETMLVLAWFTMLLSLAAFRRYDILLLLGLLLSAAFLIAPVILHMDSRITPLMPVLDSPLLAIHVSVTMLSFAMLSITFVCGAAAIAARLRRGKAMSKEIADLQHISRLFLYPALAALGTGIFIGAIWANISWGTYWSWDPKETWALITFMCYAVAAHSSLLPFLRRPMGYHVFVTAAFLALLMTYLGVNYLLGGMHSYSS